MAPQTKVTPFPWSPSDYVALDATGQAIAWHRSREDAEALAVARGVRSPLVVRAMLIQEGQIQIRGIRQ